MITPLVRLCLFLAAPTLLPAAVEAPAPPPAEKAPQVAASKPPTLTGPARWAKEVATYERQDKLQPPAPGGIVFTGSSSIRLWSSLGSDFPGLHVLGRGIGGSVIPDNIALAPRLVYAYQPRQVVFYCGGNDLNLKRTPTQVAEDFQTYATQLHAKLPQTRLSFISISPNYARLLQIPQVRETNTLVQAFCAQHPDYLEYINCFTAMLGSDGQPLPNIFRADRLHMNPQGYAIWTRVVAPHLLPEPMVKK